MTKEAKNGWNSSEFDSDKAFEVYRTQPIEELSTMDGVTEWLRQFRRGRGYAQRLQISAGHL